MIYWLCRCECGNEKSVSAYDLRSRHSKSCGCQQYTGAHSLQHGLANTPIYNVWHNMVWRCYNPRARYYHDYGGRGITVCARWLDVANFASDMGEPPKGLSIDRKDNDGHYSCGKCEQCVAQGWSMNCRWSTPREQSRNSRRNMRITFRGLTLCLAEWAERIGMRPKTLESRLCRGWTVKEILTVPPQKSRHWRKSAKEVSQNGRDKKAASDR
jgi:hypothetical protein